MSRDDPSAESFERHRDHLRRVAFRMLGSLDEADDAVQRAWLRADQADLSEVANLAGWLRTTTARVCLDTLRSRRSHEERSLDTAPTGSAGATGRGADPEDESIMAESVGLALLVGLDRLSPAQRVAFVLHDHFAVPFEDIAMVIDRSADASKKLASRARQRVRGQPTPAVHQHAAHEAVVKAFSYRPPRAGTW